MKRILLLIAILSNLNAQENTPIHKQINGNELFAVLNSSTKDFYQVLNGRQGLSESSFGNKAPAVLHFSSFGFSCIYKSTGISFCSPGTPNPGPIYNINYNPTKEDKLNYRKIWEVSSSDIISHKKDFRDNNKIDTKINSIYSWPGRGNPYFIKYNGFQIDLKYDYAPFIDVNKDGMYNPDDGDYPHIKTIHESITPSSIAWRIENYINAPFMFELRSTFWQLNCDEENPIKRTIFCSMELINRSTFKVNNLNIFLLSDGEIGCYVDDYFGTAPEKNAVFFYNADEHDGSDSTGNCNFSYSPTYTDPPVLSLIYLNQSLDAAFGLFNNRPADIPCNLDLFFSGNNFLKNERTGQSTTFEFSENPNIPGSWSMKEFNYEPFDVPVLSAHRYNELEQDSMIRFDYAFLLTKDEKLNYVEKVNLAINEIGMIQNQYAQKFLNSCNSEECVNDCVWPGDTNNDGEVNYLDAVNIFYGYNTNGTKRNFPIIWNPQFSEPWNLSLANGQNAKFADSNGDGLVDFNDLDIVTKYYSFKHGSYPLNNKICEEAKASYFYFTKVKEFPTNPSLRFDLNLNTIEEDFQGISFEIDIESGVYSNTSIFVNRIWMDTLVTYWSYVEGVSTLQHKREKVVFFNSSQVDKRKNSLISWSVGLSEDSMKRKLNLPFSVIRICNGKLYKNNGQVIPISSDTIQISNSKYVSNNDFSKKVIIFFPNPTKNIVQFTNSDIIKELNILNLQGQFIKNIRTNYRESTINLEELNSGIYLMEIITLSGKRVEKLCLLK